MSSRSTLFAVRRRLSAARGAALLAAAGTLVTAPSASAATTSCANITPSRSARRCVSAIRVGAYRNFRLD